MDRPVSRRAEALSTAFGARRMAAGALGPSHLATKARFARRVLLVLSVTLGVILFGAIVRITGSGAGCGQHWPTCQGEIIHLPRKLATTIELTHRITSGLSVLMVFWLAFSAFRVFAPGDPVRRAAATAAMMMIVEALLGAALVKLRLVGGDASIGRAVVMPLHLVSTSILTASLVLAAWWSLPRAPGAEAPSPALARQAQIAGLMVLLVSASGAVTALGDTVFPVSRHAWTSAVASAGATAHFLERLRVVHPVIAVVAALFLFALGANTAARKLSRATRGLGRSVLILVTLQIALGSFNVLLSAPGWMQVIHLLTANLVWLSVVLLAAELNAPRTAR